MSQKIVIGGNRLGSGKKMTTSLDDYGRSTHNLSEKWASSAAPGVLYPCFVKPVMRGDSFDIEIAADARTLPTKGALFGSYKMQIDFFFCPLRLYQALLHNNPLELGLNMKDVMLPRIIPEINYVDRTTDQIKAKFSNSCLLKYLGVSGLGTIIGGNSEHIAGRAFNAVPVIAYYDIFKNYYANKQEENAYVITESSRENSEEPKVEKLLYNFIFFDKSEEVYRDASNFTDPVDIKKGYDFLMISIKGTNLSIGSLELIYYVDDDYDTYSFTNLISSGTFTINKQSDTEIVITTSKQLIYDQKPVLQISLATESEADTQIFDDLVAFPLKNIDKMRYDILSHHELGTAFNLMWDDNTGHINTYMPYKCLLEKKAFTGQTKNSNPMNGLVVKTYQNDIFNNWLNAEWLEGENGINELTKVEIVDGAFSMDALNFAQKLYNMLNRVAIAGGTYEDWQDVVYEQMKRGNMESPVYLGGMSQDIYFDEVIQTAPAEGKPLGELGGRGKLNGEIKGGKLHAKISEAGFIMGIVSLTPRIFYTQGNEFYMTELFSVDDFHKPALDGIGYQDLLGERLAYFDTQVDGFNVTRNKIGKLPAWIEYMTSVDRAFGDFAETEGRGYMILNRNYEQDETTHTIKDVTTYVDPSKYNYAFADASLTAQNFWLEILFKVEARRKMSARIIPNV